MLKRGLKYCIVWGMAAVITLAMPALCHAQSKQTLKFDDTAWDFGVINETDGPVSHTFTFTNTGSSPIVIERVTSDCGCTVPKYSSEPVRPKQTGTIEVVFDPMNYDGRFSKTVSVFSNNGKNRNMLTVTGSVTPRERTVEDTYIYPISPELRADVLRVPFEYITNNTATSKVVNIINVSQQPISLSVAGIEGSGHMQVHAPASIAPGERSTITLTYDLSPQTPTYGMLSDRIRLSVNGKASDMVISAHAIAIEDFSETGIKTPEVHISPVFHNFGKAKQGNVLTKEITISNTGTAPLIIRSVSMRNGTECSLQAGTTVDPGKEIKISVSINTKKANGIITGGVTLITNDPERPMRDIRIAAEVVK